LEELWGEGSGDWMKKIIVTVFDCDDGLGK
jgi:hypothetical protein